MARTVTVRLVDDIDGGDADETVAFSLDGRAYEIDLSAANAQKLRNAVQPYVDKAVASRGGRVRTASTKAATLFSRLDRSEKERFRAWATLPSARRIADSRVQEWIEAGRP